MDYIPMSESSDKIPNGQLELYDKFQGDKEATAELLKVIRVYYRKELDNSGFTTRFIDAMGDMVINDPKAQLYVAQMNYMDKGFRVINAVLREQTTNSFRLHVRRVGEEMNGMIMPTRNFDDSDMELAISQLDRLEELNDNGIISLDQTLSWPEDIIPLIE